ncbi:MAG: primosomal replication protein N [Fluviibacter sp.]
MTINRVQLSGQILSVQPIRYTPAGIPVTEASLGHHSEQQEAGLKRQVTCEVSVKALGNLAHQLAAAQTGTSLTAAGFLATKSLKSRQLILHLESIEFQET